ncbi:4Fe-4S binding protein [Sphaerisporangium fuscum]|uniref:4Fe-4S binding protein n=1 Tax=Sphaerisporangium fuscum TaxID=2835868 RepID=UPI001BDC7A9E|nr:4Fe-4S binding protein [Sphaerisporangium fuscum]
MLNRADTQQYPEVKPDLPARSRGVIALVEENCTVCMLCARECPDWCIYIDSHKETTPAPEGGRPRAHNVLDRFAIDFSLCMYCGICIEVCPFDALFWSPEFEYAEHDIRDLIHEKEKLGEWVQTIPIPPAHDPNAEPPKELAASRGPARPARERPAPPRPARPEPAERPPDAQEEPAAEAEPGAARQAPPGPERRPGTGTGRAAVRAIRPPGALPKKPGTPGGTAPARGTEGSPEPPQSPGSVEES